MVTVNPGLDTHTVSVRSGAQGEYDTETAVLVVH